MENRGKPLGNDKDKGRQTRWSARQLAIMSIFTALGVLLSFLELPLFPPAAASAITYDPSNIPAMLGGFAYGAGPGSIIGILSAIIHGLLKGNPVGAAMNIIGVVGFVVPAALICRKNRKSNARLITGLVVGGLVSTALMILSNFAAFPLFFGIPFSETPATLIPMILPILVPFNLLKVLVNGVFSFVLYKSLYKLLER